MASSSIVPLSQIELPPGFRFHPTDEELVLHYLWRKAESEMFSIPVITELDLHKFDPWDLPGALALLSCVIHQLTKNIFYNLQG